MLLAIKPMSVIFIGAIVAIVGGVISAIGTLKHNRASSDKSTNTLTTVTKTGQDVEEVKRQNQKLTDKSETLQEKVDSQYSIIDELRNENSDLHSKLREKNIEILRVAKEGLDVSMAGFTEQRQNFVAQNRPVLQVENFQIGERMDELFNYEIKNVNSNPAQIIWVVHGLARNKPDLKAPPSNIKIFEGRKLFRPPHGSRYYPEYLRSVYAVSNIPIPIGLYSPFMRSSSFRSGEIPLYFVGQVYYADQVSGKVFDYMFCVELRIVNEKLHVLYLRNEPPIEIPPTAIKPGVDEPNASFDYYLDLTK